ncbi:hypothetical protein A1351_12205 [Methylosinus sp. R-45379]|jgi:hypothetical protein|uniref:hypothetical protein n=1 Tax=Hyphomicrobiales TaxID=356 RepID=UPI000465CF4E|nr:MULTISPECIES: hypothetical protein [unclassified Methylosinus]OAI28169.1 hypothetical protein A1351_12205 [Methylosinus sp. R-45379]
MIRQYYAQRRQGGDNPKGVGVIAVGSIYYLQNDGYWRDRFRGAPIRRNPCIVLAFLNGVVAASRRSAAAGKWEDVYVSGRSDLALVRSLRDGRIRKIAVRTLILHDDLGMCKDAAEYPTLPRLAGRKLPLRSVAA